MTVPMCAQILGALQTIQQQQLHMSLVQDEIRAQQLQMAASQAAILRRVDVLEAWQSQQSYESESRGQVFSSSPSIFEQPSGVIGDSEPPWFCPLCPKHFKHRFSFRGHVRRLVQQSSRPKCHLNPRNAAHVALVRRFPGADFYDQARCFCREFHAFCSRVINRTRCDADARRLVQLWLDAARASDGRDFPECSSCPESSDPVSGHSSSHNTGSSRRGSSSSGCGKCCCPCHATGLAPALE